MNVSKFMMVDSCWKLIVNILVYILLNLYFNSAGIKINKSKLGFRISAERALTGLASGHSNNAPFQSSGVRINTIPCVSYGKMVFSLSFIKLRLLEATLSTF